MDMCVCCLGCLAKNKIIEWFHCKPPIPSPETYSTIKVAMKKEKNLSRNIINSSSDVCDEISRKTIKYSKILLILIPRIPWVQSRSISAASQLNCVSWMLVRRVLSILIVSTQCWFYLSYCVSHIKKIKPNVRRNLKLRRRMRITSEAVVRTSFEEVTNFSFGHTILSHHSGWISRLVFNFATITKQSKSKLQVMEVRGGMGSWSGGF